MPRQRYEWTWHPKFKGDLATVKTSLGDLGSNIIGEFIGVSENYRMGHRHEELRPRGDVRAFQLEWSNVVVYVFYSRIAENILIALHVVRSVALGGDRPELPSDADWTEAARRLANPDEDPDEQQQAS